MMQAERDVALRHAASLQQSLTAALADASACRRGLASAQQQLQQRDAEIRKMRGEQTRFGNRRASGESGGTGPGSMPQSRRNSG